MSIICFASLCSQYPAYLSENEGKLQEKDLDLYRRQYNLMTSICGVYEEEQPEDTDTVKTARFEKLLDLMQQVCFYLFKVLDQGRDVISFPLVIYG